MIAEVQTTIEEFREIPSRPGYRVSRSGVVKGRYGVIATIPDYGKRMERGDFKEYVRIRTGGKFHQVAVVNLVAEAFVGSKPEHTELAYRDGAEENHHASNLYYRELPRPIPGYPGYSIIANDKTLEIHGRYGTLKITDDGNDMRTDYVVRLRSKDSGEYTSVALLACLAYHGEPPNEILTVPVLIDGNGENITPENLKWGTSKEAEKNRLKWDSGEFHLSIEDKQRIWEMGRENPKYHPRDIANAFEISFGVVWKIVTGKRPIPKEEYNFPPPPPEAM